MTPPDDMEPSDPSAAPAQSRLQTITCYLDFISPFAWLAFSRLPQVLTGLTVDVRYKPVLFAAMLKQHGQLGPAEIMPKRDWTYRHVLWLADSLGIDMQMPASHPFNPLPLLRLAVGCSLKQEPGVVNRYVCETLFRHVWQGGADAADDTRFAALAEHLLAQRRFDADQAKTLLSGNTAEALEKGVFGVPSFEVDGKVFWGLDGLPMLRSYLDGSPWFATEAWDDARKVHVGIQRARA